MAIGTLIPGASNLNGVMYGLDVHLSKDAGSWYSLLVPGSFVQDGTEYWYLGNRVIESLGNTSGINQITLRHERDFGFPIVAYDSTGIIPNISLVTGVTSLTLEEEDPGWYVGYLPDQGPFSSVTILVSGATLNSAAYTIHHNRIASSLSTLADEEVAVHYVCSGIKHEGSDQIILSGTYTSVTIEYRTQMPAGGVLPSADLTTWNVTGASIGSKITQTYGEDAHYYYEGVQEKLTPMLLCLDIEVGFGQIRTGFRSGKNTSTESSTRQQIVVKDYVTSCTIFIEPISYQASYTIHGVYLVPGVDPENRETLGRVTTVQYITTLPYSTTASTVIATISRSTNHDVSEGVQGNHYLKVGAIGEVDGYLSMFNGDIDVTASSGATIRLFETELPGFRWYEIECGLTSQTISISIDGSIVTQVWADTTEWMPDFHLPGNQYICPFVEVERYEREDIYTIRPRLRNQWGKILSVTGSTYVTLVTIHLEKGQLLEGGLDKDDSYLPLLSTSICTALGGDYVYLELEDNGRTFFSPKIQLPPAEKQFTTELLEIGLGVLPFIVDDENSLIDNPSGGRVYLP